MHWMHALVAFVACLSLTLYATPVPATSPGEISSLPDVISPDQPDNVKGRVRELGRIIERPPNIVVDWSLLSNEEIDQIVPSRFNPDKISKSKVFTKYEQLQLLKPMAIIRVTNDPNPDPALLTRAAFLPRFRSSLSLLQYLRDVHSDTQSAKALAVYVLRLGKREEELKRAEARAYQRLLARSSTYQIMDSIRTPTPETIVKLKDVPDDQIAYFLKSNLAIKRRFQEFLPAISSMNFDRLKVI